MPVPYRTSSSFGLKMSELAHPAHARLKYSCMDRVPLMLAWLKQLLQVVLIEAGQPLMDNMTLSSGVVGGGAWRTCSKISFNSVIFLYVLQCDHKYIHTLGRYKFSSTTEYWYWIFSIIIVSCLKNLAFQLIVNMPKDELFSKIVRVSYVASTLFQDLGYLNLYVY